MCQLEVAWLSLSPLRHPTLVMTFSFLPPPLSPPPYIHSRRVYIRRNIRIVYLRTVIPASSGLHSPLSSRHDWYPHPHSARLLTKWIIKIREWDHSTELYRSWGRLPRIYISRRWMAIRANIPPNMGPAQTFYPHIDHMDIEYLYW